MHLSDLREKEIKELISMATDLKIENPSSMRRHELIFAILKTMAKNNEEIYGGGVLEILPDGFGRQCQLLDIRKLSILFWFLHNWRLWCCRNFPDSWLDLLEYNRKRHRHQCPLRV